MDEPNKKAQFTQPDKQSKVPLIVAVLVVTVVAVSAWLLWSGQSRGVELLTPSAGVVQVPLAEVSDGKAHFYRVEDGPGDLRFFLVKSIDGVVRSAFDSCDVCYKERKGYRQEGATMVCNNCNQVFPTNKVNDVKGGCNPAPLESVLRDDTVVIQLAALQQGRRYFASQAH